MFLAVLGAVCQRHGWRVHAWVLMSNHYHLLLETPQPNLVSGMRQLQQSFTQRFNRRHAVSGHLFGGRYKAVLVETDLDAPATRSWGSRANSQEEYFGLVADYIHLNPLRAGLVRLEGRKGLLGYPWSSLRQGYAIARHGRPAWLEVSRVLAAYEVRDDARGRKRMLQDLAAKARGERARRAGLSLPEGQSLQSTLRRGWYFGKQEFAERILALARRAAGRQRGGEHYEGARLSRDFGVREAERLAKLGERRGTKQTAKGLGQRLEAAAIALVIRERTSVSLAWVAQRFGFGNANNAAQHLHRYQQRASLDRRLARLLEEFRRISESMS